MPVRYENRKFQLQDRENKLLKIVGSLSTGNPDELNLNQDVNLYVSELSDPDAVVKYSLQPGRQAYINCIEGSLEIEGYPSLGERDALEVCEAAEMIFSAPGESTHFIIIEMVATD